MPNFTKPDTLDFLLAQVCHLHHFRAFELLEALGLYRGQPPVLRALWEQEGLTHTELAERLQNSPGHHHQNAPAHGEDRFHPCAGPIPTTSASRGST